jgi:hypothetical protein
MNLYIIYLAMAVFGLGVTIIDFLGVLEPSGDADGGMEDGGTDDGGDDYADSDSAETAADDVSDDDSSVHDPGSYLGPGSTGIKTVTVIMSALRFLVYVSLGAGPTGLFALLRGLSLGQSLLWAAGVGVAVAFLARFLRKLIRRELDSSIKPEEFLMEKAELLFPLLPGEMSRAAVRQYGKVTDIYVKCRDGAVSLAKGTEVRIIDCDNELYWIEAAGKQE